MIDTIVAHPERLRLHVEATTVDRAWSETLGVRSVPHRRRAWHPWRTLGALLLWCAALALGLGAVAWGASHLLRGAIR